MGFFGRRKSQLWDVNPQSHGPGSEWGSQVVNPAIGLQGLPQPDLGMQGIQQQQTLPMPPAQQEQQKMPSFFQRDSTHDALATFADTLVQLRSGVNPGNMRARQQQAYLQAQSQRDQAKRFAGLEDYEAKKQIDQDYLKPTALERNVETFQNMTPEQRQAAAQYYDMVTPKLVQGKDGRAYPVRRDRPAIGQRIKDPRKGGPSQPAAGSFRR